MAGPGKDSDVYEWMDVDEVDLMGLQREIIWFLFTENEEPTETGLLPYVLFFF